MRKKAAFFTLAVPLLGIAAIALLGSATDKAQAGFQGRISYHVTYKSKDDREEKRMKRIFGDSMHFYFRDGYYKQVFNTKGPRTIKQIIYLPPKNRMYIKVNGFDSTLVFDCTNTYSKLEQIAAMGGTEKVAGQKCKLALVTSVRTHITGEKEVIEEEYWYSPVIEADSTGLGSHRFEGYAEIIGNIHSLPLKHVRMAKDVTITRTAAEYEEKALSNYVFAPDTAKMKPYRHYIYGKQVLAF